MTHTQINHYIDPDGLAIAIRKEGHGAWAWVERVDGRDTVITNRSLAWVRRMTRRLGWITP